MKVTYDGGGVISAAWYDVQDYNIPQTNEDITFMNLSSARLRATIAQEARSFPSPRRIILAGNSQGGGLCLYSMFSASQKMAEDVAGVAVFGSYLPRYTDAEHVCLRLSILDL